MVIDCRIRPELKNLPHGRVCRVRRGHIGKLLAGHIHRDQRVAVNIGVDCCFDRFFDAGLSVGCRLGARIRARDQTKRNYENQQQKCRLAFHRVLHTFSENMKILLNCHYERPLFGREESAFRPKRKQVPRGLKSARDDKKKGLSAHSTRYAALGATFLAARPSIRRVVPVMIMLIPTSVPITHSELDGHCRHTSKPRISVTTPSNRIQPEPGLPRALKYATRSNTPSSTKKNASARVKAATPSSGFSRK